MTFSGPKPWPFDARWLRATSRVLESHQSRSSVCKFVICATPRATLEGRNRMAKRPFFYNERKRETLALFESRPEGLRP